MAPKSVQTAPEMPAGDPKHAARATRSAGRQMRSRLLDGASRPVQGAGPCRHLDLGHRGGRGRVSEPDHLLLPHQGSACSSKPPAATCCMWRARPNRPRLQAHTPREYTRALVETRHGDGFGRLLYRSADAHPPPPGSRAAGGAHHRAAARRGHARLCRPDRAARLENLARSRCQFAAVLGARDRRDGRGPCDGPFGGRNVQPRCCACWAIRRRQGPPTTVRRLRLVGDRDASDSDPDGERSS